MRMRVKAIISYGESDFDESGYISVIETQISETEINYIAKRNGQAGFFKRLLQCEKKKELSALPHGRQ